MRLLPNRNPDEHPEPSRTLARQHWWNRKHPQTLRDNCNNEREFSFSLNGCNRADRLLHHGLLGRANVSPWTRRAHRQELVSWLDSKHSWTKAGSTLNPMSSRTGAGSGMDYVSSRTGSGSGVDSGSSWIETASGMDSASSRIGMGSGVDSVSSRIGTGSGVDSASFRIRMGSGADSESSRTRTDSAFLLLAFWNKRS